MGIPLSTSETLWDILTPETWYKYKAPSYNLHNKVPLLHLYFDKIMPL